jgi:O-antigen/teichoic acid export membrane protein
MTTTPTTTPHRLGRDIAWNVIPVVLLAGVGLGLNIGIGSRAAWGPEALGVFNQVTTAYFVLAVFGALGIQYSVLREVAAHRADPAQVAAIVVGALVPTAVLGAIVTAVFVVGRGAVAALLDSTPVADGMLWAAPGLFCFTVNKVLFGVVNGLRRMRAFAVYTSLRYAVLAVGFGIAVAVDAEPAQLGGLWTLTEGALLLVLAGELVATVALRRATGWRSWVAAHLRYGTRGAGATLLFELNSRLDIWLLGAVLSDDMVGIYSMAASIAEGVSSLTVVLQVNVNPTFAAALAGGRVDEVHALVRRTRRWFVPAMFGVCALGAAVFPLAIPWLTGDLQFLDGALPFATLVAGIALASAWLPFNQVLLMGGHPGWHTIYIAVAVAANVVLNLLLIPRLGLMGAATATAIALVASALWLRGLARRLVGVRL